MISAKEIRAEMEPALAKPLVMNVSATLVSPAKHAKMVSRFESDFLVSQFLSYDNLMTVFQTYRRNRF